MGPAETTGIVIVTVAVIQGLISLVKFVVEKLNGKNKSTEEQGLSDRQGEQLTAIYETVTQKDGEGMHLVYFPRQSMGDIQKEIATQLRSVAEMQLKMLGIIERMKEDISK